MVCVPDLQQVGSPPSPVRSLLVGIGFFVRVLWRNKAGFIGFLDLFFFLALALLGPILVPDVGTPDITKIYQPPSWEHPLGTDYVGMVQRGEAFLPLIPPPREMTFGLPEDAFWIDSFTSITLGVRTGEETLFATGQLQRTLKKVTGLCLLIERSLMPLEGIHRIVLLRLDRDGAFPGADARLLGREGYLRSIQPERVVLAAPTETGLFYAVQTLRQLLRLCGRRLPSLTIRDWPVLSHRGVMLDVSRGKVPTSQTLLHLVEQLAAYKYNHFQLNIEHTFLFPSHPSIGAGADLLTADDLLALDAHCRAHHIELVPNFQSFGHQRRLLSLPQYAHL